MESRILLGLSAALCGGLISCSESEKKNIPVNVIYILADDLGYGDLGCYGQQLIKTPNIDRMASEGLLFTQNYAGCSVSAPSRCSLMTGLHTGHTQIRSNKEIAPEGQHPMAAGTFTLGRLMKSAGYTTGMFGKWGLGNPGSASVPNDMGFDEFYGYNCQRQSHSFYPDHLWHNKDTVYFPENVNNAKKTYSQDLIHKQALKFINDNKDKPFFAMLTYTLPHAELNLPHDSIYNMYENSFKETPYIGKFDHTWGGYNTSEKPCASFAAMVSRLDMYVGEVMAELKKLGLDKNTLVIFTSDNGPHAEGGAKPDFFKSSGPLKGIKRDAYEGGIRVPMIAWWPKTIKEGKTTNHVTAFWDVMPTLAELTGTTLTAETDGISFLPLLKNNKQKEEHDYLYWEFHESKGWQAIREGNFKLIRQPINGNSRYELYDLSCDVHEDNNLADQFPDKVKAMAAKMDSVRTTSEYFDFGREKRQ